MSISEMGYIIYIAAYFIVDLGGPFRIYDRRDRTAFVRSVSINRRRLNKKRDPPLKSGDSVNFRVRVVRSWRKFLWILLLCDGGKKFHYVNVQLMEHLRFLDRRKVGRAANKNNKKCDNQHGR
jgi:hypothetical protein